MFDVANMLKIIAVKDVPVNNYEFLNIQASSFIVWVHQWWPSLLLLDLYEFGGGGGGGVSKRLKSKTSEITPMLPNSSGKLLVLSSSPNIH